MKTRLTSIIVATSMLFGLSFVSSAVWADSHTTNTDANTTPKKVKVLNSEKEFYIQNFKQGPIEVEFRYVKRTLKFIQFKNASKEPQKLSVLNKTYILGPGDSVVIDIPNVKYVHMQTEPYNHNVTSAQKLLHGRFGTTHTYKMPVNKPPVNNTTQ